MNVHWEIPRLAMEFIKEYVADSNSRAVCPPASKRYAMNGRRHERPRGSLREKLSRRLNRRIGSRDSHWRCLCAYSITIRLSIARGTHEVAFWCVQLESNQRPSQRVDVCGYFVGNQTARVPSFVPKLQRRCSVCLRRTKVRFQFL